MNKWRTYELLVYNYCLNMCNDNLYDWEAEYNIRKKGKSGANRQIDILMKSKSQNIIKIVDCKNYNKKLDIKDIELIIGMIEDLRANAGVVVSVEGFTKNAYKRAEDYGRLELKELSFKDLFQYRFCNNERISIYCPNCYEKKNIFLKTKNKAIIDMTSYDIVYKNDIDDFIKVNVGFCEECQSQIFHCTQCNKDICISIDDLSKRIKKKCSCGVCYSFFSFIDYYGNYNITYGYFDECDNELLSENNLLSPE